jgi:hypothetical protein
MSAVSIALMFKHLVPLEPGDRQRTERALVAIADADGARSWTVVHVLYADCACSNRVARHLVETARAIGVREHVLLVGDAPDLEALAKRARLDVRHVTPAELLDTYGLDAAPLLIVADPERRVRYVGGYTQRKQSYEVLDRRIVTDLREGRDVIELPVFGCAISPKRETTKSLFGI